MKNLFDIEHSIVETYSITGAAAAPDLVQSITLFVPKVVLPVNINKKASLKNSQR